MKPGHRSRILVVDDTPGTIEIIERNLSPRGFEVFRAGDVAGAVDLLERTPVDLVITDLKMPRASGRFPARATLTFRTSRPTAGGSSTGSPRTLPRVKFPPSFG